MIKSVSTGKKPRSNEFRKETQKPAERIGVVAAARELSLYESQLYNWRSKQQSQITCSDSERGCPQWLVCLVSASPSTESLAKQFRLACDTAVSKAFTEAKHRYGAPRLAGEQPEHNVKTITASLRRQGLRAKTSRKFSLLRYLNTSHQ